MLKIGMLIGKMNNNIQTIDENEELRLKQIAKEVRLKILDISYGSKRLHWSGCI
ncbi:MAG: hypothetical protein VZR00_04395 [Lachnospiraceae bacterium]|jgi:hypothetical protein|nr:hypothetical protein [Lachnospiraceae bacterium]MEE3461118.1 hypothetical protein [Lachnospiraceae bacterium]